MTGAPRHRGGLRRDAHRARRQRGDVLGRDGIWSRGGHRGDCVPQPHKLQRHEYREVGLAPPAQHLHFQTDKGLRVRLLYVEPPVLENEAQPVRLAKPRAGMRLHVTDTMTDLDW